MYFLLCALCLTSLIIPAASVENLTLNSNPKPVLPPDKTRSDDKYFLSPKVADKEIRNTETIGEDDSIVSISKADYKMTSTRKLDDKFSSLYNKFEDGLSNPDDENEVILRWAGSSAINSLGAGASPVAPVPSFLPASPRRPTAAEQIQRLSSALRQPSEDGALIATVSLQPSFDNKPLIKTASRQPSFDHKPLIKTVSRQLSLNNDPHAASLPQSSEHKEPTSTNESTLRDAAGSVEISRSDTEGAKEVLRRVRRSTKDVPGVEAGVADGPLMRVLPRSIMENFADDFDKSLADDYFNQEPHFYDMYYDDINSDISTGNAVDSTRARNLDPDTTKDGSADTLNRIRDTDTLAVDRDLDRNILDVLDSSENREDKPLRKRPKFEGRDNAELDLNSVDDTLEMRLLGPDFKSELGFVLEKLTNGSQQRNRRHQIFRHHDPRSRQQEGGITVGRPEGECPPPSRYISEAQCRVARCVAHSECYPYSMCCYNGCVFTCALPIQPAPALDWVMDTDQRRPVLEDSAEWEHDYLQRRRPLPRRVEPATLSYGTAGEETVDLPGGCVLPATKYAELKQFMTADSIQDCLCRDGEVVCMVKSTPPADATRTRSKLLV
ncbi:uncharacterized protein LOC108678166 [Hyalella azteca]|uniref:Uncharacterized protein LOC108678166 n=1 Tax=Hyalella azteca TaxID=294128 RepID=A0A8B7P862_HYAAZ|nr:uncharacterized protein LOC108678166 [Hyalella azteca]